MASDDCRDVPGLIADLRNDAIVECVESFSDAMCTLAVEIRMMPDEWTSAKVADLFVTLAANASNAARKRAERRRT